MTSSKGTQVPEMLSLQRAVQVLPLQLRLPCTRSGQNHVCHLLGQLEACNAVLWHLGLQLQEDEADNIGDMRLVALELFPHNCDLRMERAGSVAFHLLLWLFTRHRCLVYVELTCNVARCTQLAQALANSRGVKKLLVRCCEAIVSFQDHREERVLQLIESMTQIEELLFCKWRKRSFHALGVYDFAVCWAAPRLTVLDVAHCDFIVARATEFIAQLIENNTVTNLSVSRGVFQLSRFADYLNKDNPTLKTLALRSEYETGAAIWRSLVNAISTLTTLEELTMETGYCGVEDTDLFAQLVLRNKTLRRLSLVWPIRMLENRVVLCPRNIGTKPRKTVKSWLPALKRNCVLEALTVDFQDLEESECHAFFRALMQNTTLTRVTLLNIPSPCDLKEFCATIRECGLGERVVIKNHFVDSTTFRDIPDCPEVTAVSWDTMYGKTDYFATLDILGSCRHITSAFLMIDSHYLNSEDHPYLAAFIAGAATLKELWLNLVGYGPEDVDLNHCLIRSALIKAVSLNTNLNAVTLIRLDFSDTDCPLLVESAVRCQCLHHISLDCGNYTILHFLRHLAPVVANSYNLLQVQIPYCDEAKQEHFTVQEVTRRNSGLLNRATDFVLGIKRSYCERALEFFSEHPKLVEMVEDRAAVKCNEAKAMIKRALSSITDMNGFMRAAGVVKYEVKCCARRDGQMQLDELHYDCWLHVRKYIKLADIQETSFLRS